MVAGQKATEQLEQHLRSLTDPTLRTQTSQRFVPQNRQVAVRTAPAVQLDDLTDAVPSGNERDE